MTTVRSAKAKGSSFEYDCQHSLNQRMHDVWRTSERGFQLQYDLEDSSSIYECKRLKSMSWNQAKKFFYKLKEISIPKGKSPWLLFKSNRQPCLVMFEDTYEVLSVVEFKDAFGCDFEKHPSTRKK